MVKQYQRLFEMENIDLTLAEEALGAISRKAIDRKTGARGLRSIMEGILLDTMFDLPSLEGVEEVVISKEVVEGTARPLYIYADRSDRAGRLGLGLIRTALAECGAKACRNRHESGEFLPVFRGLLDTPRWHAHLLRCKYCVIDSGPGSSELRTTLGA